MSDSMHTRKEVAERGEDIYNREIRAKVESECNGKYLVLDIDSGEYEIDQHDLTATKRMMAKRPNAVLYGLRIRYVAAYRLGGFLKISTYD